MDSDGIMKGRVAAATRNDLKIKNVVIMKTVKLVLVQMVLLLGILLVGCNNELVITDQETEKVQPILLSSKIDLGVNTFRNSFLRVQDTQFENGRKLNLFVTETGDLDEILYNVVITADGNGGFTHQPMFYPMSGNNIDFYAVHPQSASADLSNTLTFSVATDQTAVADYLQSDLLYASKANVARTKNSVLLNFSHKLSKLSFTVAESDEADLALLSKLNILNVKPSTTLELTNGLLGSASGQGVNISAKGVQGTTGDETEVSGIEAIVVPQVIPAGVRLFEITIGTVNYYYQTTEELTFSEGKKYNLKLTIRQTGIELTSSIEDWTDGGTITGEGEAE